MSQGSGRALTNFWAVVHKGTPLLLPLAIYLSDGCRVSSPQRLLFLY